jgi:hypothetical protein
MRPTGPRWQLGRGGDLSGGPSLPHTQEQNSRLFLRPRSKYLTNVNGYTGMSWFVSCRSSSRESCRHKRRNLDVRQVALLPAVGLPVVGNLVFENVDQPRTQGWGSVDGRSLHLLKGDKQNI